MTLSHVWYLPIAFHTSREDILMSYHVGALLDSMTLFPLAVIVLFAMLQDHRRPLWSVAMMFAPLVIGMMWRVVSHSVHRYYVPLIEKLMKEFGTCPVFIR